MIKSILNAEGPATTRIESSAKAIFTSVPAKDPLDKTEVMRAQHIEAVFLEKIRTSRTAPSGEEVQKRDAEQQGTCSRPAERFI